MLVSTVLPAHWVTVSAIWGFSVSNRAVRMVGRSQSRPPPPSPPPPALCALSQDWTLAVLQFPSLQTDKRTCGERCGGKTARLCAPGLTELAPVERSSCHSGLGPVCGLVSNPHPRQACQVWGSGPFDGRRLRLRGTLQPAKGRTEPQPTLLCPLPRRLATGPSGLTSLQTLSSRSPGHALHLNQESGGSAEHLGGPAAQLGPLCSICQWDPGLAHPPAFPPLLSLQSALCVRSKWPGASSQLCDGPIS